MNVFVAKLSPATTGQDLEALFGVYGEIVSAKVIFDKETGNSKGYGFVEMKNDNEALAAIEALNESEFDGKQIVVKEAKPREDNTPRPQRKTFQRRGGDSPNRENYGNRRY
ncbi:MAG TPA: RNA-binding protein [Prolixibacteraceae bacterium]|nr:RNA-binding protein [Prolixibacteraceae bacterium]